jgi:hypothetical protein
MIKSLCPNASVYKPLYYFGRPAFENLDTVNAKQDINEIELDIAELKIHSVSSSADLCRQNYLLLLLESNMPFSMKQFIFTILHKELLTL